MATPDLQGLAAAAAARGSLLFHLFLAETLAGDALGPATPEDVRGWAVDVGVDGYEVSAIGGAGGREVVRRVTFAADGSAQVASTAFEAAPRLRRLAAAREAGAEAAKAHPHRYASIAVPPPRDGRDARETEVYLVRLAEHAGDVALGPHWRLRVAAEDGAVHDATPVCGTDEIVPAPAPARTAALRVTYEDDLAPSELHAFLSLQHGLVLEVATPRSGRCWRVEGEAVTVI